MLIDYIFLIITLTVIWIFKEKRVFPKTVHLGLGKDEFFG